MKEFNKTKNIAKPKVVSNISKFQNKKEATVPVIKRKKTCPVEEKRPELREKVKKLILNKVINK